MGILIVYQFHKKYIIHAKIRKILQKGLNLQKHVFFPLDISFIMIFEIVIPIKIPERKENA